jgi:hypothetical protein
LFKVKLLRENFLQLEPVVYTQSQLISYQTLKCPSQTKMKRSRAHMSTHGTNFKVINPMHGSSDGIATNFHEAMQVG